MARTQVQSELIATNAISGTIIADNAITATHIATNSISGTLIQDSGIVTTMIAANNITSTKIVTDGVLTRHIADDQVTGDKLTNNITIAGTLTSTGAFTSPGIDDNADATAITIDSSERVGIGMVPSDYGGYMLQLSSGTQTFMSFGNNTTGTGALNGLIIGNDANGADIYQRENQYLRMHTNNVERMRIGNTGKVSWSAGGIGAVGTQSRDFTFYTEGGSNGVDIRSNDYQIAFIGGAGSSGAGMDKGYMQLCLDGGAKVAFNTDGNSFFNGGKLGIGEDEPNEPLTVRSSAENINTTLIEVGNDLHATNTKDAWIKFVAGAATNDYSWAIGAYPTDFRFSYLGARATAVATAANVRLQISNGGRLTYNDTGTANAHGNFVGEVGSGYKALSFERTVGGGEVGNVVANASSTTYNTSSDYRLKENVDYSWDATTRLKQLKPARFNWIADDTNTLLEGFLAHEVSSIVPEAVSGEKDAMADPILYEDGDELPSGKKVGDVKKDSAPEYQGIDHSKLVPLMVKTIQELEARIKILEG